MTGGVGTGGGVGCCGCGGEQANGLSTSPASPAPQPPKVLKQLRLVIFFLIVFVLLSFDFVSPNPRVAIPPEALGGPEGIPLFAKGLHNSRFPQMTARTAAIRTGFRGLHGIAGPFLAVLLAQDTDSLVKWVWRITIRNRILYPLRPNAEDFERKAAGSFRHRHRRAPAFIGHISPPSDL